MNRICPHCSATFESEPGFYFGAMFVSYAFNVAIFIGCWLVMYLLFDVSDWVYVVVIGIVAVIMTPINFRLSRLIWLYWFGGLHYDPSL